MAPRADPGRRAAEAEGGEEVTAEERAAEVLDAAVAAIIRAAVAEERERCAKIAEAKAVFHRDNCHKSCACADGWHIALAIRAQ